MICAGYPMHGVCEGDSGGPLVCNNYGNSPYSLVGVTSHVGKHCRNPDGTKPSIFTNVYNYLDWIQTTTTMNCTGFIRSDNGHCYKFVNEKMAYAKAEEHCQTEGSYLVEIGSQIEQYFLQGLVEDNDVWIGLQDKDQNGNWSHWNSGASLEYSNWYEGEPNNDHRDEYCTELRNEYWNGEWNDENCKLQRKFVCERGSNQTSQEPRKCYSFHKDRKNYTDAQDTCASMGGHLVEINSEWEQLIFKAIYNNVNKYDCHSSWFWLGLNNQARDGDWRKWNSGASIMSGDSAHKLSYRLQSANCAGLDSDEKWHDSDCDTKLRFICENSIFTNSNVHTLCEFDMKEQMIADADPQFPIERSVYCMYICSNDGHCYKYVQNAMTYSEAEQFCRSEGSYLVEIGNQMEQYFLQGLLGNFRVWIGLHDKDQNGKWSHWNSGTPVSFSNWADQEPNNWNEVEYCGELNNDDDWWKGQWNDQNCELNRKFVCERGGTQAFLEQRKCYSYHREQKNYTDAQDVCSSEKGYLVEINSDHEQLSLQGWVEDDQIWLGLSDIDEEGNWKNWKTGAPVTFSNWDWGEPNNIDKGTEKPEDCAAMVDNGEWNDSMCGKKLRFVCENTSRTTSSRNVQILCNDSG